MSEIFNRFEFNLLSVPKKKIYIINELYGKFYLKKGQKHNFISKS